MSYFLPLITPPFFYVMEVITEQTRQDAFVKALSDLHNKCNGYVVREPSHVLLPEEEYPVSIVEFEEMYDCLLYTSPSPRDGLLSRMPSSA